MTQHANSQRDYHAMAQALLARVESIVDRWLDEGVIDIDSHRSGGLLELTLPDRSKIVLNAQPPLQEMWLAARAGGYHYRHVQGRWLDRSGAELFDTLSRCVSDQAGQALQFSAA